MNKNYILDTNILLQDPESILKFEEHVVVIPIGVIEELDGFKKGSGELGRNARQVSRILDTFINKGDLCKGVPIDNGFGGIVRVIHDNSKRYIKQKDVDFHVLHIAHKIQTEETDNSTIIISRDTNVRVRAKALGFLAENYRNTTIGDNNPVGHSTLECNVSLIDKLYQDQEIDIDDLSGHYDDSILRTLAPNHYVNLLGDNCKKKFKSVLAKVSPKADKLVLLPRTRQGIRIEPKNKEQTFLIDALLDENIRLVCATGKAGTGKTLLASAIGHYFVEKQKLYKRLLISRPVFPMGKDLGFLPGDVSEKLDPWMQPIYDALELIIGKHNVHGKAILNDCDNIYVEPLTYIRGRSIHEQFVIIDEAQNLTPLEIKTIITRAGQHTKVVLTGDVSQIDNPYIDAKSNGLTVVANNFTGSSISAHIELNGGVRSELAEEATNRI